MSIYFYFIFIAADFFFISLKHSGLKKSEKSHVVLKHTDIAKSGIVVNQMYQKRIREGEVCALSYSLPSLWLISITWWVSHTHLGTVTVSQTCTPYTRKLHLTLGSPYSFMVLVFVPLEFGSIQSSCLSFLNKIHSGSMVWFALNSSASWGPFKDKHSADPIYVFHLQRMGSDLRSWLVLSEQPPASQNTDASQWLWNSVCSVPHPWKTNSPSALATSQVFFQNFGVVLGIFENLCFRK